MPETYSVKVTAYAENAILEIRQYIFFRLQSPQNARNTLFAIREGIKSLNFMPARVQRTPDEPWGSRGIRRLQVKNFYVYFLIGEEEKTVYVTNVVYVARNQRAQLMNMDMP